jgi:hypothetical protein
MQSLGKDVGSAAPQYKVFYVHPINSTWNNGESLADDIWSTGDEFVVCEEQPELSLMIQVEQLRFVYHIQIQHAHHSSSWQLFIMLIVRLRMIE